MEKRSFWEFNVGHVLVLVGMAGSVMAMFVQRERDMALLKFTSDSTRAQIQVINARIDAVERSNSKLEVIENDIRWIREEISRWRK